MPRGARCDPVRGHPRRVVEGQVRSTRTGRQSRRRSGASRSGTGGRRSGHSAPASPTSRRGCASRARRTFADLADEFEAVAMPARPRKKTTVESTTGRRSANHLRPWFGRLDLARLSRSPEEFERYAVAKMRRRPLPKTVRNHLVLAGLMFKTARRWRWVSREPARPRREALGRRRRDGDDRRRDDRRPDRRLPAARGRRRRRRAVLVRGGPQDDRRGALHGPQARRTARAAVAGRRPARAASDGRAAVRPAGDHVAEVQGGTTDDPARPGRRRALEEQYRRPGIGRTSRSCSRIRRSGTPLDPSKLTTVREEGADEGEVPKSFRPWHGMRHTALTETAAAGVPGDVRAGEGRPRAGLDDGAISARAEDVVPGRGRTRRGAAVRSMIV